MRTCAASATPPGAPAVRTCDLACRATSTRPTHIWAGVSWSARWARSPDACDGAVTPHAAEGGRGAGSSSRRPARWPRRAA
eukprot:11815379-Alexandrium_andersonii.AAC.1